MGFAGFDYAGQHEIFDEHARLSAWRNGDDSGDDAAHAPRMFDIGEREAHYRIAVPPSKTLWSRIGRVIKTVFSAGDVLRLLQAQQAEGPSSSGLSDAQRYGPAPDQPAEETR